MMKKSGDKKKKNKSILCKKVTILNSSLLKKMSIFSIYVAVSKISKLLLIEIFQTLIARAPPVGKTFSK